MEAQLESPVGCPIADRHWRLNHLYSIATKEGKIVPFKLNWMQRELLDDLHFFNLVLKARQLGASSFIQIYLLDACLFNSNIRAGVICHKLDDARSFFKDKIRLVYDHLPDALKAARPIVRDSADEIEFSNGSSIRIGLSLRSSTMNLLHISEFAQVCSTFPDKAKEIISGALNTLAPGSVCFIESTASGAEGIFYEMCQEAQARQRLGTKLTPIDPKFHFYPWWKSPEYQLDPAGVVVDENFKRYFDGLEEAHGITLTADQKAWYARKGGVMLDAMKREFPSTANEAFEGSIEGCFYSQQLARAELEQRVGQFDADPAFAINTAWDIGVDDSTAIWFFQVMPGIVRLVGYFEASGEGVPFYLDQLERMARANLWTYATHFFPADVAVREWGTGHTRIELLIREVYRRRLGKHVQKVPGHFIADGINAVRQLLGRCQFDAGPCAEGLKALRAYRRDWNEEASVWRDKPRHDWASHGADAFRALAMSYRDVTIEAKPDGPRDPLGRIIETKPRTWKYLSEMNYDEFHSATGSTLDGARRRHERV
jgi:hypothetical protein